MKLIPYEEILYHTNLEVPEVLARLNNLFEHKVETKPKNGNGAVEGHYSGEIDGLHFKLSKKEGLNPFHPIIDGTVEKMTDQTRIDATFSLPEMVIMLFIVWSGILLTGFVYLIIKKSESMVNPMLVGLPLVLLVFSYVVLIVIFNLETRTPKKMMDTLLEPSDKE